MYPFHSNVEATYMHVYACYKHILLIVQSQKNTSFMQENIFEIQTRAESKRRATWRESHETGSNRGALKTSIHIPLLLCRSNTRKKQECQKPGGVGAMGQDWTLPSSPLVRMHGICQRDVPHRNLRKYNFGFDGWNLLLLIPLWGTC